MASLVVLGGGYAGRLALAHLAPLSDVHDLVLVDAAPHHVERVRLHEVAAGGAPRLHDHGAFAASCGARFVQDRAVAVEDGALRLASGGRLGFDRLVVATGSVGRRRPAGVHGAATLGAAVALGEAVVAAPDGARVVVVGLGLTGLEVASEIAWRHPRLRVEAVGRGDLAAGWSPSAVRAIRRRLARLGVALREGMDVAALEARRIRTPAGWRPADLVVDARGFAAPRPVAGLPVDPEGRVPVDGALRVVGRPEILVAGDAAAVALPWVRQGCVTAMPLGVHAADVVRADVEGRAAPPFGFAFPGRCVALGGPWALWQATDPRDVPTWAVAGWGAGVLKSAILWMTVAAPVGAARLRRPLYSWSGRHVRDPAPRQEVA